MDSQKQPKELPTGIDNLHAALIKGDECTLQGLLRDFISSMCSFHDLLHTDLERNLHIFVLGLLAPLQERYMIKSNLESGFRRYDICLHPRKGSKEPAVIIEFKKGEDKDLERLAEEALKQIRENRYESLAKDFGYKGKVLCYGIATFKKHVMVKMETRNVD